MSRKLFSMYDNMDFPPYEYRPYPRMLYHPQGAKREISAGDMQTTHAGPVLRNQHFELITKTVNNTEEEAAAIKAGWHLSPKDALAAATKAKSPLAATAA